MDNLIPLKKQWEASKLLLPRQAYQQETERYQLTVKAHPNCYCDDEQGCTGSIDVMIELHIAGRTADRSLGYIFYPLADPFQPMAVDVKPGPFGGRRLTFGVDKQTATVPDKGGRIKPVKGSKGLFGATSSAEIPCAAGTYARRFTIVQNRPGALVSPGTRNGKRAVLIEAHLLVEPNPKKHCEGKVKIIDTFMVEYERDFDHTYANTVPGNADELSDISPNIPGKPLRGTKNLMRRVAIDGWPVALPFPKRVRL